MTVPCIVLVDGLQYQWTAHREMKANEECDGQSSWYYIAGFILFKYPEAASNYWCVGSCMLDMEVQLLVCW